MDYIGNGFCNFDISSLRKEVRNKMDTKIISFISPLKRKTESEIEISKVEKMALDKKMSYGQYVAKLEEEKKKDYMQH